MPHRVRVTLSLLVLALAAGVTAAAASSASDSSDSRPRTTVRRLANTVANSGFEGTLAGWRGYNATLSLVAGGVGGGSAARVAFSGSATSFSLYPSPRPVATTIARDKYVAGAFVRSQRVGKRLCLRVREYDGASVVGSAESCVSSTSAWQAFPVVPYTVAGSGRQLDVYVYQWGAFSGDSFDVDSIVLTNTTDRVPPQVARDAPAEKTAAIAVDNAHIRLDWSVVPGAVSYRVLRGGLHVGTTSVLTFTDALLWPATDYAYAVEALDAGGAVLATERAAATTAALPAAGFRRPYPDSSFWNTPIAASPTVHSNSDAMVRYFLASARNPNFALRKWNVAVAEQHPSDPGYDVPCWRYRCNLQAFGPFGIPVTAQPDPSTDGHLVVYDPVTSREWSMSRAARTATAWQAAAGGATSMLSDASPPPEIATGNAANFPLLGGIVRPEEILQGRIDHALVFAMPGVGTGAPVCPASHNAGSATDTAALRAGQKIQLDPALNVDALPLPAWQKTIARAMQRYGAYLRDGSGSLVVYGENPIARGYDAWGKLGFVGSDQLWFVGFPWDRIRVLDAPDYPNC